MQSTSIYNRWEKFGPIVAREYKRPLPRLTFHMQRLLMGIDPVGKRVLDIGCGRGIHSAYLALAGAAHVVGIDPEGPGSSPGATGSLPQLIREMNLTNCEFLPISFQENAFSDGYFDLVLSVNSINHLYEVTTDLRQDPESWQVYEAIFAELFRITAPGGVIMIEECSRANLFRVWRRIGLPHPIRQMASIEWDKHQYPKVWATLLKEAGFEGIGLNWHVPYPFRGLPWLFDNALVNFCTFSGFVLRAQRQ